MDDHTIIILLTIIFIVGIIIYLAYVYYSYKNQSGIFAYNQTLSGSQWQPFGKVLQLSEQEQELRKQLFAFQPLTN